MYTEESKDVEGSKDLRTLMLFGRVEISFIKWNLIFIKHEKSSLHSTERKNKLKQVHQILYLYTQQCAYSI